MPDRTLPLQPTAAAPLSAAWTEWLAVSIGLPALLVIVYANLSDLAMRNLGTPSIVQPLVAVLALTVALLHRRFAPLSILLTPVAFLLAGYCAFVLASGSWAADPAVADVRTAELVKDFAIAMTLAILVVSWRALRGALIALVSAAAILAALTIVQHVTGSENELFGLAALQQASVVGNMFEARASGPIDEPNFYAQMLLIVIPLAAGLALAAKSARARIAFAAAAVVIAAGMALTYSRGAMVALLATVLAAAVFVRPKPRHVGAAVLVAVVAVLLLPGDVRARFGTMGDLLPQKSAITERDASLEKRKLLYEVSLRMFEHHPILGVGAGNFYRHFAEEANLIGSPGPQYEDPSQQELPHSLYLEVASETGSAGLLIFFSAIGAALVSTMAARRQLVEESDATGVVLVTSIGLALVAYLVSALFLHSGFPRPLWILMAFVAAACRLARRGGETEAVA